MARERLALRDVHDAPAAADEAREGARVNFLDPFAMRKNCGDCAFVAGTDAHGCEATRLTASLCVDSGELFYCHRPNELGELEARLDGVGEPVLCRGFVDALKARGPVDDWRASVASESLRILDDAKAGRTVTPDEMLDRVIVAGERAHLENES